MSQKSLVKQLFSITLEGQEAAKNLGVTNSTMGYFHTESDLDIVRAAIDLKPTSVYMIPQADGRPLLSANWWFDEERVSISLISSGSK